MEFMEENAQPIEDMETGRFSKKTFLHDLHDLGVILHVLNGSLLSSLTVCV